MTTFLTKVKAIYTLRERLQTVRKPKHLEGVTSLVGYATPTGEWLPAVKKTFEIVKSHNIPATLPKTKSGHISVCVVTNLTEAEREAIRNFAQKAPRPQFKPIGVDLLPGRENLDYMSIAYAVPNEYKRLFEFIRNLCGAARISDFRKWYKDHVPHASLVTVDAAKREEAKGLLPDVWQAIKGDLHPFKPEFVEFFDKMELSEFYEITGVYCAATTAHFYICK